MYDFFLTEEDRALKLQAREFARRIPRELLIQMDNDDIQYPKQFVKDLAQEKLLGLRFDKECGGQERSWVAEMAVLEEIGILSMALSCLYSLPSICGEALNTFGTAEQKRKFLKPIISGEKFCAEALTEPRGGSDFFGATTTAVKDGDEYILNGQKRFVVGAEGADIFLVYAKTDPDAPRHKSISLFIVERDSGVEAKYIYGLMGTRGGGAGRLYFRDVRVPASNIILGEGEGGRIFNQMMYPERMTSAAGVIGMAQGCIDVATRYARKRKAFGKPIRAFEGVNFKLADALCQVDAARGLVYTAARALDTNQNPSICRRLVSEAKRVSTELCYKAIDNCLQILGGIGYTNVFPIERYFRDARLAQIWTGTSEIMNLIIQHEHFAQYDKNPADCRDIEVDAAEADALEEKIYE
ncbi:MAG: acyl-CoA/acyl-ACP dehydrogenase [Candidatus Lokiarchaeota archaeon]|nr:acyl-CoA/acyl-ACP dehydrogenase [Candidatus Harpocratesius repetitus]